jgi:hypothetical protein
MPATPRGLAAMLPCVVEVAFGELEQRLAVQRRASKA